MVSFCEWTTWVDTILCCSRAVPQTPPPRLHQCVRTAQGARCPHQGAGGRRAPGEEGVLVGWAV